MATKITEVHSLSPEELVKKIIEAVLPHLKKITTRKHDNDLDLLTRNEVAVLFKVTLPTIISWGEKGILNPFYIGNRCYYKKSEILRRLHSSSNIKEGSCDEN